MSKRESSAAQTSAQQLGSLIKSARDIMRKDKERLRPGQRTVNHRVMGEIKAELAGTGT